VTLDSISRDITSPEERMREQMLEQRFGSKLSYEAHSLYFAEAAHLISMWQKYMSGTILRDLGITQIEVRISNIWDTDKLKALLAQPVGSPVDLTIEEANEITRLAAGRRPDLPPGKDFVKEVRELLGHSLIERLEKAD